MGSKDDAVVVDPCGGKISGEKQAIDIKIAGEISASGRMEKVGTHVSGSSVSVKNKSCLSFFSFVRAVRIQQIGTVSPHPDFTASV